MSYAKRHATEFAKYHWFFPMIIAYMKFLGGLFAAVANFVVLMTSDDLIEAIKDFIAVAIIY